MSERATASAASPPSAVPAGRVAPPVSLDVFADVACPWCFIAHRRLGHALDAAADLRLAAPPVLRWRAYQLERGIPARGVDAVDFAEFKLGGRARREAAWAELSDIGAADGIRFAFARQRTFPNTLLAHRIISLAPTVTREAGSSELAIGAVGFGSDQRSVAGALFAALFEEGVDIGDVDETLDFLAATGIELEAARVRHALAGGAGLERVREDLGIGTAIGIDAVPVVMANLRHAVWGAQPDVVFRRLLVVADQEARGAEADGELDSPVDGPVDRPGEWHPERPLLSA